MSTPLGRTTCSSVSAPSVVVCDDVSPPPAREDGAPCCWSCIASAAAVGALVTASPAGCTTSADEDVEDFSDGIFSLSTDEPKPSSSSSSKLSTSKSCSFEWRYSSFEEPCELGGPIAWRTRNQPAEALPGGVGSL